MTVGRIRSSKLRSQKRQQDAGGTKPNAGYVDNLLKPAARVFIKRNSQWTDVLNVHCESLSIATVHTRPS
jgi:hypothetical protein